MVLQKDKPLADPTRLKLLNTPTHRELARQVVIEGAVLLQNNGILPLSLGDSPQVAGKARRYRIVIVGPSAGCVDNATDCSALREQVGGYTGWSPTAVSLLAAAYNGSLPAHVSVSYYPGTKSWTSNDTSGFAEAVAAAKEADVVVAAVGDGDRTCGEAQDRTNIELPGVQPELLSAIADTGIPVVAVLIHGRPVSFERLNLLSKLSAVVAAWRPGAQGGPALWSLLTGQENFSGKLTQAWTRSTAWIHTQVNPWFSKRRGGRYHTSQECLTPREPGGSLRCISTVSRMLLRVGCAPLCCTHDV